MAGRASLAIALLCLAISTLPAEVSKKIGDVQIDTMKYLSLDDIEARYDPTRDSREHLRPKPLQRIEAGFSDTGGNTRTTTLNAKYTLAHRWRIRKFAPLFYTLELSAFLARDEGRRTAEEYKALFSAKQPLPRKWLGYVNLGWLKNDFQNFAAKVDFGIGVGKILYRDSKQTLVLKLGPALNHESYTNGGNDSFASFNQYLEYNRKIRRTNKIYLKLGAKENFADMQNDYEINTLLGILFNLDTKLDMSLEYDTFYDNTPSEGFGKTDTKTVVRIGYRF